MTEEELKQEAREWIIKNSKEFITNPDYSPFDYAEVIYMASAEPREKRIAELEKEKQGLKGYCDKYVKTICSLRQNVAELEKVKDQLTKAKEIIKKFLEFVNNEAEYDPEHPQEHTDLWNELCEEAEQFLSEVKV